MPRKKTSSGFSRGNSCWRGGGGASSAAASVEGEKEEEAIDDNEGEETGPQQRAEAEAPAGAHEAATVAGLRARRQPTGMDFGSPGGRGALKKQSSRSAPKASPVLDAPDIHYLVNGKLLAASIGATLACAQCKKKGRVLSQTSLPRPPATQRFGSWGLTLCLRCRHCRATYTLSMVGERVVPPAIAQEGAEENVAALHAGAPPAPRRAMASVSDSPPFHLPSLDI